MAKAKGIESKKSSAAPTSAPAASTASNAQPDPQSPPPVVLSEERYRLIAEAAYFRAEARGFQGGDPVADWLEAEAEINRKLMPSEQQDVQQTYESSRRSETQQGMPTIQKSSAQGSSRPRPS